MNDFSKSSYSIVKSDISKSLNTALKAGFYKHGQSEDIKRTHLFNGRYENIYIDDLKIPEIKTLLDEAISLASPLIDCDSRIGIVGTLDQQKWETDEGVQRSSFQLLCNSLEFIKTDGRGFEGGRAG